MYIEVEKLRERSITKKLYKNIIVCQGLPGRSAILLFSKKISCISLNYPSRITIDQWTVSFYQWLHITFNVFLITFQSKSLCNIPNILKYMKVYRVNWHLHVELLYCYKPTSNCQEFKKKVKKFLLFAPIGARLRFQLHSFIYIYIYFFFVSVAPV